MCINLSSGVSVVVMDGTLVMLCVFFGPFFCLWCFLLGEETFSIGMSNSMVSILLDGMQNGK